MIHLVYNELTTLRTSIPDDSTFEPIDPVRLSTLIHALVHDIGNPMTSIISYSGLIEQGTSLSLTPEQLSPFAKKISNESWKVMKLVDLLLLSLSQRSEISSFSLQSFKQTLMSRACSRYGLGEADLLLNGFDSEINVKGDLDQITLLSCEIISNALGAYKALENTDDDGCSVNIEAEVKENKVTITFLNQSPKHNSELSSLFSLSSSEFPRSNKPPGIGLFSLARTIRRWGGEVEISELQDSSENLFFLTKVTLEIA